MKELRAVSRKWEGGGVNAELVSVSAGWEGGGQCLKMPDQQFWTKKC